MSGSDFRVGAILSRRRIDEIRIRQNSDIKYPHEAVAIDLIIVGVS